MIETGLKGKVALITGANHGIGAETARTLAKEGVNIIIAYLDKEKNPFKNTDAQPAHYLGNENSAIEIKKQVEKYGVRAITINVDLSSADNIINIFDKAEEEFSTVDILINNAAHCEVPEQIFEITAQRMDRHYQVNTRGTALMMKEFINRHKTQGKKWGKIINLSQDAAQCNPGEISYGSSKATIDALTRSVAVTAGPLGITVNAIAPGPVHTGNPSWISPQMETELTKNIPLSRCGQPIDIANAILFLVSTKADWITGQVIKVDGGHACHRR